MSFTSNCTKIEIRSVLKILIIKMKELTERVTTLLKATAELITCRLLFNLVTSSVLKPGWPRLPHVPHVPHASLFTLSLYITFWIEPKRIKIQGVRNMRKLYLCFVKFQMPNRPLFLHWCPAVPYKSNPFHRRWIYTFPQSFVLFPLRNVRY